MTNERDEVFNENGLVRAQIIIKDSLIELLEQWELTAKRPLNTIDDREQIKKNIVRLKNLIQEIGE